MFNLWKLFQPLKIFIRTITGQGNIPTGPCIVTSNHEGPLDTAIIMWVLKRSVRFVAARHLMGTKGLMGWYHRKVLFSLGQAIPSGEHCIEACRKVLHHGQSIGIFPEGDIHPKLRQYRIHTGAVVLSHLTQIPILPVRIENSSRLWPIYPLWKIKFWRLRSITVTIGQPILPPIQNRQFSRSHYQSLSDTLIDNIVHMSNNENS